MNHHTVEFRPSGRGKARNPPDPRYPDGMEVTIAKPSEQSCRVELPYPAPECGALIVRCQQCGFSGALTCAGRPDDPRAVTMPCQPIAVQADGQHRIGAKS